MGDLGYDVRELGPIVPSRELRQGDPYPSLALRDSILCIRESRLKIICNVDTAVVVAENKTSWATVIQDTNAEAFPVREAMSWLKEMRMDGFISESDGSRVIKALNNTTIDNFQFGFIIKDII
ncbi:hypothetical protein Gohar_016331 [Gossypium harknessii]|uniref:Uncharacterized protein n=1 Tax=Gossypium harknessii TaxID=34285 RepID=A0A7J9G2W7_9ROSI|nr:hypothetical protein [Gossypium harknessii]